MFTRYTASSILLLLALATMLWANFAFVHAIDAALRQQSQRQQLLNALK